MSLKSRVLRRTALAGLSVLAAAGAGTAPASAAKLTLTYQCTYPLIGEAPLKVDFQTALPSRPPYNSGFDLLAGATASGNTNTFLKLIGAKTLDGRATATTTFALSGGASLPVTIPLTVDPFAVPTVDGSPSLPLTASGTTPPYTLPSGTDLRTLSIDAFGLSLRAGRADGTPVIFPGSDTDSDQNPDTFDVTCRLDPDTQSTRFPDLVLPTTPTTPVTTPTTPLGVSNVTSTGATIAWTDSLPGGKGPYWVGYSHGAEYQEVLVPGPSVVLTDLLPGTTYTVGVTHAPRDPSPTSLPEGPFRSFTFRTLGTPSTPTTPLPTSPGTTPTTPANNRLTNTYACSYPLIGEAPVTVNVTSRIPAYVDENRPTGGWPIGIETTSSGHTYDGLTLIAAKKVDGTTSARLTLTAPGIPSLPVSIGLTNDGAIVPSSSQPVSFSARGEIPSLTFPTRGPGKVTVDSIALSLKALKADGTAVIFPGSDTDSDKDINTFDVTCRLDPSTQDTTLAAFQVGHVDPPPPTTVSTTPRTTPRTTPTTPATTIGVPGIKYSYDLTGSATLKTLTKGTLPLSGSIFASLDLATGAVSAELALNPTSGKLVALGFLPVVAKVNLVPTQKVTGTLKNGVLTANAVVRIKLPSVSLFGIQLVGGANCQAKSPSNIALKSTDPFFKPLDGGTLAGTFAISDLAGCGGLTGLVSPLTAGKGNAIALKLSPKP